MSTNCRRSGRRNRDFRNDDFEKVDNLTKRNQDDSNEENMLMQFATPPTRGRYTRTRTRSRQSQSKAHKSNRNESKNYDDIDQPSEISYNESEESGEEETEELEIVEPSRKDQRNEATNPKGNNVDSEKEEELQGRLQNSQFSYVESEEEAADVQDEHGSPCKVVRKTRTFFKSNPRRKKHRFYVDDDDDEYNPNEDENHSTDDDAEFIQNESSSEESEAPFVYTPRRKTRNRKLRSRALESNSSSSEEYEFDPDTSEDENIPLSEIRRKVLLSPSNICPECPSKVDAITSLPLSKVHVCWIAPDKQSRQCFNLDTLKKVSLNCTVATRPVNNEDYEPSWNAQEGPEFLQPPHFRTVMEDSMKNQIVAKFGREALILHQSSSTYTSLPSQPQPLYSISDEYPGYNFLDQLNQYARRQMGSADLYCCPLCYNETYRRLILQQKGRIIDIDDGNESDEKEDESDEEEKEEQQREDLYNDEDILDYKMGPMTILGSFQDEYSTAASFCYRKLIEVKNHIRNVHDIDCSVLDGNGLFHRFRIRDSDGLLQRYLKQATQRDYWAGGYSFEFVQLLHIASIHAEIGPSINPSSYQFSKSFPRRARILWEILSSPYLKPVQGDLDAFLDDDEVEDEYTIEPQQHLSFSQEGDNEDDPDKVMVRELRRRRGKSSDISNSENSEDSEASDESKNSSKTSPYQELKENDYENDEEDDDWLKKKRYKPKKKKRLQTTKTYEIDSDDESLSVVEILPIGSNGALRSGNNTKKRRKVYESSDDESI